MVEALGRRPPASRYSPDLSKHYSLGSDERLKEYNVGYVDGLKKE
jgi:betaine-homocysteine S-methyltransferase